MDAARLVPSLETIQRFDKPGPRYTSYPTAVEFHEGVGSEAYAEHLRRADAVGPEAPLSLYVHVPFCQARCTFCGCHVIATTHTEVVDPYLADLEREIGLATEHLRTRRGVAQLHLGGGTPTYLSPGQIRGLLGLLGRHFTVLPGAEVAIEVDPRVTTREHLDTLRELGFNRLSMGVQDFTPEVQDAIGRHQTYEQTRSLIAYARELGFDEGVNLDLIYGLPLQKVASFERNLEQVLSLRPDRVAVYSFAYVPWIRGHQKRIEIEDLPKASEKVDLYLTAMRRFLEAGYEPIGMDHFALPEDELSVASRRGTLHRNFMGYTVKPATDMIGFGVSSIGDVQAGYFQNQKKLSRYREDLAAGRLPVERGYLLTEDDRLRRAVITSLMCRFTVSKPAIEDAFGVDFDARFADALADLHELVDAGFVSVTDDAVTVSDEGRLFVRNVCMAFDAHLRAKRQEEKARPVFSRTL